MRWIINSTYISLDGVIETPGLAFGPHQDDGRGGEIHGPDRSRS